MRRDKTRVHVDRISILLDRLVVLPREEVARSYPSVDDVGKGIELPGAFRFRDSLLMPAYQRQVLGVPMAAVGVIRVQIDRTSEFAFGFGPVAVIVEAHER